MDDSQITDRLQCLSTNDRFIPQIEMTHTEQQTERLHIKVYLIFDYLAE